MPDQKAAHTKELLAMLKSVRRHLRLVRFAKWLLLFVSLALGVPVLAVLAEFAFHPTIPSIANAFHLLLWAIYGLTAAVVLLVLLRVLFRRLNHEQVAVHVETAFPQLKNILINSVQLAKDKSVAGNPLVRRIITEAVKQGKCYNLRESVNKRILVKLTAVCLACTGVFGLMLYGAQTNPRVANAIDRLLNPFAYTPVVGSVEITEIDPENGQVFFGEDQLISARYKSGKKEIEGTILYTPEGQVDPIVKRMSPIEADRFAYRISDIRAPFEYRLQIGDTETRSFRISVVRRPEVKQLDLRYAFPTYTGKEPLVETNVRGNIRAVAGTVVTLSVTASKPIAKSYLLLNGKETMPLVLNEDDPAYASLDLRIKDDGFYTIHLIDAEGYANKDPITRTITALPDARPVIRFTAPGKNIDAVPGQTVKLALRAADDYGLREVAIFFQPSPDSPVRRLEEWKDRSVKEFITTFDWYLDPETYQPGSTIEYYGVAFDKNITPGKAQTPKFTITIKEKADAVAEKKQELQDWERRLSEILKAQRLARGDAADAQNHDLAGRQQSGTNIAEKQKEIRSGISELAESMDAGGRLTRQVKQVLLYLSANDMAFAIGNAEKLARAEDQDAAATALAQLIENQEAIIAAIEKLFGVMPDLAQQITEQPDLNDGYDMPSETQEKLKDLVDKLKEFTKEQKKVIDTTADLAKRPVDDFTEEDEKLLEELVATEEKWSRFMKEAYSDFSKMPVQDFSNPSMLKELLEIQSEVQMKQDALQAKATELATALEDNGLELAEALTTHIEKWLPDSPDRLAWKMEEVLGDYESPMAELPKELEDLIGDLMEEQEDIFEEMEDATSTYADSIDKGAGWDAMDGPIMNMSAQGVTGNTLPNNNEMGGRSGEGRTGKSSGEFVEETATGKGGRDTPTRLTPDPFEQGFVKDTSNEAPGGSTGGGKISGAAQEGMEGPVPPELQLKLKSLAKRQAAIRNKAEKITARFKVAHWPSLFEETVDNLDAIEEDLTQGRYQSALRKRSVVLKKIDDTRRFVNDQLSVNRDWSSPLPAKVQDEILDSVDSKAPRGYEDLLKSYYQSLAKTDETQ